MTDKEIIKALECCISDNCRECPLKNVIRSRGCAVLWANAFDLINRQKEEINALNGNTEKYIAECEKRSREIAEDYRKEIRAEVIKEIAERYTKEILSTTHFNGYVHSDLVLNVFNNIVKEITGREGKQ